MSSPSASEADEPGPGGPASVERVAPSTVRPAPACEGPLARRLLFLDDDPERAAIYLAENPHAVWVQTVPECLNRLIETWDEVHLDHDLGGKTFVDSNEADCGMEVIRWLCASRHAHLRQTLFLVHSHNFLAGMLMVLQMRSSGYRAESRPFGLDDPARLLPHDDDGPPDVEPSQPCPQPPPASVWALRRWFDSLRRGRTSSPRPHA